MTEDATVTATAPPGGSAVATAIQPTASVSVVEHGEASRMPDTSWVWRRLLIFGVCIVASALLFVVVLILEHITERAIEGFALPVTAEFFGVLKVTIRYGFYTLWLGLSLYGVGATVTDLAKLAAAVKTSRREMVTSTPPRDLGPGPCDTGELPPGMRVHP